MATNGWRRKKLSEITKKTICYGIVQAGPHVPSGVPYLKSSNVGGTIEVATLQRTSPEIHKKYYRSAVSPGDIVFSLRGNIAATSIVPDELPVANLTQGTARISVCDSECTEFVQHQLSSKPVIDK